MADRTSGRIPEPVAGFWRPGMASIHVCSEDQIHNPIHWECVISSGPPGSNFLWMNGELYDPETADLTIRELEEVRFEFEGEADERQEMEMREFEGP